MNLRQINFGYEDGRNIPTQSAHDVDVFLRSFVPPNSFQINDFYSGRKHFVYGGKGSGKTALLRFIQLTLQNSHNVRTDFFFFQDKSNLQIGSSPSSSSDKASSTSSAITQEEWHLLFMKYASNYFEGLVEKSKEMNKFIMCMKKIFSDNPGAELVLDNIKMRISGKPFVEGVFQRYPKRDSVDSILSDAKSALAAVHFSNPQYVLFIDEIEVYRSGLELDKVRLETICSLIRAVRTFFEFFPKCGVRVIAAIREELIRELESVQYEIDRIVRDLGCRIDWPTRIQDNNLHPLEKMFLLRIAVQEEDNDRESAFDDKHLSQVRERYFVTSMGEPKMRGKLLNYTWFRPRDIVGLFEIAKNHVNPGVKFFEHNLYSSLRDFGKLLWQDGKSGLSVGLTPDEIRGCEALLRGGRREYNRSQWLSRCSELKDQNRYVMILYEKNNWEDITSFLYMANIVYFTESGPNRKHFYFRGDEKPTFDARHIMCLHQSLTSELGVETQKLTR